MRDVLITIFAKLLYFQIWSDFHISKGIVKTWKYGKFINLRMVEYLTLNYICFYAEIYELHMYLCMFVDKQECLYVCIRHAWLSMYLFTYMYMYPCPSVCLCVCMYTHCMSACTHIHESMYACIHICMNADIHIYIYCIHVNMLYVGRHEWGCMYICGCVCMNMCVCM